MKVEHSTQFPFPATEFIAPPLRDAGATNAHEPDAIPDRPDPVPLSEELKVSAPSYDKKLRIRFDDHHNEILVQVVNEETQEVLKELPPEEIRRMHRRIRAAVGLLIDRSA